MYVFSTGELDAKRLSFMSEIVPGPSPFGVLVNPKYPPAINQARYLGSAATKIGRDIYIAQASNDGELETALGGLQEKRVGGLVVASDPFFDSRRKRLIAFASERHLPAIYQFRAYALEGGLPRLCARRRTDQLWPEPHGHVSASGRLCRTHP
jgi:putative ABC transport system substrate-binding protein